MPTLRCKIPCGSESLRDHRTRPVFVNSTRIRFSRQGSEHFKEGMEKRLDPWKRPYYWYGTYVQDTTGQTDVDSVALAQAFDGQDLGLLCMLDDNEHAGLESFEATEVETLDDGTKVYSGPWKECRPDDPRHFVIVEPPEEKTLVYWATPKVEEILEKCEWPRVYRERNAIQELSFKGMIDHGGLDINYGRKTVVGPDRRRYGALHPLW